MKNIYVFPLLFMALTTQQLSAQLSAIVHFTNPTCLSSGSAYVVASGGSNYTYKWSNGQTTDSVMRLIAGNYSVTVYSAGGGVASWDSVYLETFDSTVQTWVTNISTGANGAANNYWDISDSCIGNGAIGTCVDNTYSPQGGSNKSLYITAQSNPYGLPQYAGARYDAGGLCSILSFCTNTNLAAQSPNISTTGVHNLVLSFQYTAGGAGLNDNASLLYSTNGGTSFTTLDASLKSNNNANCNADGDVEGTWAYKSYALPAACNNISTLVIRFNWTNDGNADANATDPSIAVDNVTLRDSIPGTGGIDSVVETFTLTNPPLPAFSNASLQVGSATCGQSNGSVTGISVVSGTAPYIIEWKNGNTRVDSGAYNLNNVGAGTYTFDVTDADGCTIDTSITLSSTPAPVVPVISASPDTICHGDTAQICPTPQNYAQYLWSTGATTACISGSYGYYNLTVTDTNGCITSGNIFSPDTFVALQPVIGVNGDTLITTGTGTSYQWYLNGQAITGATNSVYIATQPGNYTVAVGENTCAYTSPSVPFSLLGVNNIVNDGMIKVYPNPLSTGSWHLDVDEKLVGSLYIIFDAQGRVIYKSEIKNRDSEIELNIASGIYTIQVVSEQVKYTQKLIKL